MRVRGMIKIYEGMAADAETITKQLMEKVEAKPHYKNGIVYGKIKNLRFGQDGEDFIHNNITVIYERTATRVGRIFKKIYPVSK